MHSGRRKPPTRYVQREKFQQHGAMPDLLSNLPKPSGTPTKKSSARSSKATTPKNANVTKEDGILFVNVEEGDNSPDQGAMPTVEEILERAQESDCKAVFEIELRDRGLTVVPDLKKFPKTRILDLSSNKIKKIASLYNTKDLRELKLYDNAIKVVEGLDDLKELTVLQLQYNEISTLGVGLNHLKKLRHLRLDSNSLQKVLIKEICACSQLTVLDLSYNKLDSLDAVVCLSNLEELHASNNDIKVLPELCRCKKLMELRLAHNRLADCQGLKGVNSLRVLDLSHNLLFGLKSVGKLSSLEYLNLSHNHIVEITYFSALFPNVDVLDLIGNRLENAEECMTALSQMSTLCELSLSNNPMSSELSSANVVSYLPNLELLDGQLLKRVVSGKNTSAGTPLMRPMSASSVISAKFVENQIAALKELMEPYESKASACYNSLRESLDCLPREAPSTSRQPEAEEPARPGSRCSRRNRIHEARMFAESMNFDT